MTSGTIKAGLVPRSRSRAVLTLMEESRELGTVMLVCNEGVGLEDRLEPLGSVASPVANFDEMFEMAGDLTFVPGDEDRFNV